MIRDNADYKEDINEPGGEWSKTHFKLNKYNVEIDFIVIAS